MEEPRPDDPLLAVVSPPRVDRFRELTGISADEPLTPNFSGWSKLVLLGRELDLSPWFVRPCLIVIGYLEDSECPIPLRVNGDPVPSDGLTVVRWVYPLPVDYDVAFPPPNP